MKLRNRFKLNMEIPTSSQSDIAFLLIIFFIVTAIFFERTGIVFKLPAQSSKTMRLAAGEFFRIDMYQDHVRINQHKVDYADFYATLQQVREKTERDIAILYFHPDLEYEKFIRVFQAVKGVGNIRISIKPMRSL